MSLPKWERDTAARYRAEARAHRDAAKAMRREIAAEKARGFGRVDQVKVLKLFCAVNDRVLAAQQRDRAAREIREKYAPAAAEVRP